MAKAIDWSRLQEKYKGLWVALADDEATVLAVGKTPKEAWNAARAAGHKKPILASFPEEIITYVG